MEQIHSAVIIITVRAFKSNVLGNYALCHQHKRAGVSNTSRQIGNPALCLPFRFFAAGGRRSPAARFGTAAGLSPGAAGRRDDPDPGRADGYARPHPTTVPAPTAAPLVSARSPSPTLQPTATPYPTPTPWVTRILPLLPDLLLSRGPRPHLRRRQL